MAMSKEKTSYLLCVVVLAGGCLESVKMKTGVQRFICGSPSTGHVFICDPDMKHSSNHASVWFYFFKWSDNFHPRYLGLINITAFKKKVLLIVILIEINT